MANMLENNTKEKAQVVMFDTNIINRIVKKNLLDKLPRDIKYCITNIQRDEINAICDNPELKNKCLELFDTISITENRSINQEWLTFDNGNFSQRFCSEEERKDKEFLSNKNKKHINDTLILLSANYTHILLISDDKKGAFKRAKKLNYNVLTLDEFFQKYT